MLSALEKPQCLRVERPMASYTLPIEETHSAVREQLSLWTSESAGNEQAASLAEEDRRDELVRILLGDLDFRGVNEAHSRHNFHAFAAKFPPQLPRLFIDNLTVPGELVLDPMMGSGTAVLEALLAHRRAAGFDLDPLAVRT